MSCSCSVHSIYQAVSPDDRDSVCHKTLSTSPSSLSDTGSKRRGYRTLKENVHPTMEIHSLSNHPPTLMENQVRIYSPQHISGASWQNIVSAFSETKWRRWRLVLKCLKTTNKKHKMAPFSSDSEIKVSGSSEVTKRFKKILHYYLIYLFITIEQDSLCL